MNNFEPQSAKILRKNDPFIFEIKCTDKRCRDKESEAVASGEIVKGTGPIRKPALLRNCRYRRQQKFNEPQPRRGDRKPYPTVRPQSFWTDRKRDTH